jgi:hypothetical protein
LLSLLLCILNLVKVALSSMLDRLCLLILCIDLRLIWVGLGIDIGLGVNFFYYFIYLLTFAGDITVSGVNPSIISFSSCINSLFILNFKCLWPLIFLRELGSTNFSRFNIFESFLINLFVLWVSTALYFDLMRSNNFHFIFVSLFLFLLFVFYHNIITVS